MATAFGLQKYGSAVLEKMRRAVACVPENEPDLETGCRACGDNARVAYEQCRQAYYLKKQTEFLASQQIPETSLVGEKQVLGAEEQRAGQSELENQRLHELLKGQNEQMGKLIQGLEEQQQEAVSLANALRNSNLLNIGLVVLIVIFLLSSMILFAKKRKQ